MERKDIVDFLKSFVKQQKSEVNYGTYRETSRSSLLNEGLSTRANSVWKQSQFVVAYYNNEESDNASDYLSGWAELTRGIYDQYLLLECPQNVWTVYDKHGHTMNMEELRNVPQKFIGEEHFQTINLTNYKYPRQIIYYGAPGTGKSHGIKNQLDGVPAENIFRTTFHPDSDYSTFMGAYKPTMKKNQSKLLSKAELIGKLAAMKKNGITYPCQKFGAEFWDSLQELEATELKEIIELCGFTETYYQEVNKGIAVGQELISKEKESKIVYSFVAQTFLQAYIRAYQTAENVYLIIEEINRGNCAQIFGDLFQLLDRNKEGKSDYKIKADADLRVFLEKELGCDSEGIKGGELCLPSNLYIYATMNTSDQSLFPIDSAFKRRWDWKYMRIKNHPEKGWKIKFEGVDVDWWKFLQAINSKIEYATKSEDKKLGYFFCKPTNCEDGSNTPTIISAETFVGKVIFYLWNDVFKVSGRKNNIFAIDGRAISFHDFYLEDDANDELNPDSLNLENVAKFIGNVMKEDESQTAN